MTCTHCDSEVDDGLLFCRDCRYLFLDQPIEGPLPDQNERILELAEACEQLQNHHIALEDFRHWLKEFTDAQEGREQSIVAEYKNIPLGFEDEFAEEVELGFNGVSACRRALTALADYDPDNAPYVTLTQALHTFYNGTWAIKEAMQINRRNRGKPLWI